MSKINDKYLFSDITSSILQAYYKVYNKLGYGLTKNIYEKALLLEFKNLKLECEHKKQVKIHYNEFEIGNFECDILVNNKVLVQVQINNELNSSKEIQLTSILKSSIFEVGLLLNFGLTPEHKRKAYTNEFKTSVT